MQGPLENLEQWDDFVKDRYDPNRKEDEFRKFTLEAPPVVQEFYRQNHMYQTRDFVLQKKREYLPLNKRRMGVWEAMEYLNTLVDDSDPDTNLSQIEHLMQTSEAIRKDGRPRWFILTGLIHDLGKIVYPEFFAANPDSSNSVYRRPLGVYEEGCGLDKVDLSWGHDEYLYHVVKDYLPEEGLYMIRYHSFYPWHREGAYSYLMDEKDRKMLPWVQKFNPYDLYSKSAAPPNVAELKPYYEGLIAEFF